MIQDRLKYLCKGEALRARKVNNPSQLGLLANPSTIQRSLFFRAEVPTDQRSLTGPIVTEDHWACIPTQPSRQLLFAHSPRNIDVVPLEGKVARREYLTRPGSSKESHSTMMPRTLNRRTPVTRPRTTSTKLAHQASRGVSGKGRRDRSAARTPAALARARRRSRLLEGVGKVLTSQYSTSRPTVDLRALASGPVVRQELPRSTSDTTAMVQLCGRC